jgi:hypothetical protein
LPPVVAFKFVLPPEIFYGGGTIDEHIGDDTEEEEERDELELSNYGNNYSSRVLH